MTEESGITEGIVYPFTKTVDIFDEFHGVIVHDPYRWLEAIESEEAQEWIEAQNRVFDSYLNDTAFERIQKRLTEIWDYEKWSAPFKKAGRYFVFHNDGLQNHARMLVMDSLEQEADVLLDPNSWSEDGALSLAGIGLSEDAGTLAYGMSKAGSDWSEWRIRDIATRTDLDDHLTGIKFSSASFTHDGEGFFYTRYADPGDDISLEGLNRFPKLCYHRLGEDQREDVVVYERPDRPDLLLGGSVTQDGRHLVISVRIGSSSSNGCFYRDLEDDEARVVELLNEFDAAYYFVGSHGSRFFFQTNLDAPNWRVISIDPGEPKLSNWQEVIPEAEQSLEGVSMVGERLIAHYLRDAYTQVEVFHLDGTPERAVELPGIGTAAGFHGRLEDTETFYAFTSYTHPTEIYRYDIESGESTLWKQSRVTFDPNSHETKQVICRSKDGTRVPMFITHRKGIALDGTNPTILYGYGGFRISQTPAFSIGAILWMEMGGIWAVACIRGGNEYGETWHEAGTKLNKQNVFDDFIAGSEWLIENGYTSSPKLGIYGGSNGGLLVGACLIQRPDLFGAAVTAQGVLDMLRYHLFTIGWAWTSDYGSVDDPEEFKALLAYSPVHNVQAATQYPATLVRTSDHDDRVWPGAALKFAATLQAAQVGGAPALCRCDTTQGHGAGSPTRRAIARVAENWAFFAKALGVDVSI